MDNPYNPPEYNEEAPSLWETELIDLGAISLFILGVLLGLLMIVGIQEAISFLTS